MFSWNLSSCEALRKTWLKDDMKPLSSENPLPTWEKKKSVYEELLDLISTEQ